LVRYPRSRAESRTRADGEILPLIRELKAAHPFWGYRRIWAYLRFVRKILINQKRVYRLLKENDLLVKKNVSPSGKAGKQNPQAASL
jgi:hypothetical protein